MATFRGISAIGTGVLSLLTEAWGRSAFDAGTGTLATKLCRTEDLTTPPFEFGVSLFVFLVAVNGTQRTLPPTLPNRRRPLPVEVSFILTPWGTSGQQELELLGWCMRVMEDDPVLPASILNAQVPGVFAADEIVEIVPAPLPAEEFFRLWDALTPDYRLSVAYTARIVRLESGVEVLGGGPVLERELDVGRLVTP